MALYLLRDFSDYREERARQVPILQQPKLVIFHDREGEPQEESARTELQGCNEFVAVPPLFTGV
jgi:hypothetical protein